MRLTRPAWKLLLLLFIVAGLEASAIAQNMTSATVGGHIEDSSGALVAGATVTITFLDRNSVVTATTDPQGRFRFLYLPVGNYELKAEQAGFSTFTRRLTLSVGQTIDVPIVITVGTIVEQVSVTEELPAIETGRTQIAATINPREIEALPLNGRNYLDLALLSPAVSRTNTGNNERFAETSAVPGTGISVAGQRNLNNGFFVDGLSANDDAADLAGTFFAQEVIREFQVITSGGIAEFGRASSGVVNILTRSGSTTWQGRLYGFLRNHRFDGTNIFAPVDPVTNRRQKSPWTQLQYGTSLAGPLKRDRAFLFSNFEQERLQRSGFITISTANVDAINTQLDRTGYSAPRVVTGAYPTGDVRSSFFAKTDYNLVSNNKLAVRYSLYDISSPNARGVGGLSTVSRGTIVADRDQSIAVHDEMTIHGRSVNELRFQFTRSRLAAQGNDLKGPAVTVTGVANFGASTSSPTARDIDLLQIADSYSTQRGSHVFKTGVDVLYNRIRIEFPGSVFGTYSFSNLASFLSGTYTTFGQSFGRIDWFQTNPNLGWFIQDEWKPRRNLTINAGVRHDASWIVDPVQTQGLNFSPRLGIAYAPGDHKTVVRLGAGLYYDRIPLRAVANALRGAGTEYKSVSLQRTQIGAPSFPNKLSSLPGGILISLATIDPEIKSASAIQMNLQLERELPYQTALSLGYLRTRGLHIIMQRNLNVPTLTATQDPVNLGRPNPNYGNINQYSGQGDSHYNGMTLSVQHRASGWVAARVSYTLSKAIDNAGNAFFSSPQNNFNIRDDRGLSDNDQRHRLTLSGQVNVRGFQWSPIFTHSSPYPFNIVTGGQTLQTTTSRLPGVGRNTGMGFPFSALDMRLSRRVAITERIGMETILETFNTFNQTNPQFPNNAFGTGTTPQASFRQPTAAAEPRQIQFGLRLSY